MGVGKQRDDARWALFLRVDRPGLLIARSIHDCPCGVLDSPGGAGPEPPPGVGGGPALPVFDCPASDRVPGGLPLPPPLHEYIWLLQRGDPAAGPLFLGRTALGMGSHPA